MSEPLTRWTLRTLLELVPGTTESAWRRMIPVLVARRALAKNGKGWLGRRSEIENALLESTASSPDPIAVTR